MDAEDEPESDRSGMTDAGDSEGKHGSDLIVVGIGASAGGFEAFTELLTHLPKTTGMAFVMVQHLDPHHESALPGLLAAKTPIPVLQAQNNTGIEPDHIYVIPPNTLMRIRGRTLVLETRSVTTEGFKPIDVFFNSLAREFRFRAVGVVLSGTASDGTLGLRSIKAEGGITFAQNQTAKFDGMPRSAIAAGVVDFVLSPRRIAEELAVIGHQTAQIGRVEDQPAGDGATLHRLLMLLRRHTGVDFTEYRQPTILRRLNRRLVVRKSANLEEYFELLQADSDEVTALFDDMLINVTDFFRDPDMYEAAKRIAFPSVIRDRRPRTIRAWVPGCSSGEEVYSLAIALTEFLESEDLDYAIQMFGTDLNDGAIGKARTATYDESSVQNVSPERLRRFFVRTESGYQINRAIREACVFSRHNVAKDPPLSRMDLISCRNLLIYFTPSAQRRMIATFGYALQPNGCLILGSSEALGRLDDHFQALDERHRIYGRQQNIPHEAVHFSETVEERPAVRPKPRKVEQSHAGDEVHRHVNRIVLSRYGPAGLVVDETLKIVEYRGDMRPYLVESEHPPGGDLMSLVRQGLRARLSTAIEQARRTNLAVVAEDIPGPGADGSVQDAITVVPLALTGIPPHFLILFGRARGEGPSPGTPAVAPGERESAAAPTEEATPQLEQELRTTREYLQSVIEELRSTNEEAQSANEELQSANEELQTSKEELQSTNEELHTINAEMQSRNADLARTGDDLTNLLSSMSMAVVMTGRDLRIRRFTPMAERVFRLMAADVGRPIADLKPRINVPDVEQILQHVVDSLQPHEQEVQDEEGRQYLMRVRPYRTADSRIDGTVLQLLDVSDLKRSLEEVGHARDYAETIVNTVREPLVVLDQNLAIQNANRAFHDALDLKQGGAAGQSIYEVSRGRFNLPEVRRLFEQLNGGSRDLNDVEVEFPQERDGPRVLSMNARSLRAPDQRQLILLAFEDVTERKRAEEARYRRLFECARDGIVLANGDTGEIMDVNPFTEGLLGYSRSELVGRKLWEIEPMRNQPGVRAAFEQIRDRGVLRFDDLTLRTKEGRDIQTEVMANVYSEGDRPALQLNIRDVGERKKFERKLQETQRLESLGLLAGGIAHDFNNLLTGIIGNASLAYSEVSGDDPLRVYLRDILRAGERAAFLTRQMLAYAGKGRFVVEKIDLGDLIREIWTLVRTSISRSVEVKLDLEPNLPPIQADPSQIQQVVMNLVINGAEAIGEHAAGRVEIRTSLRELDAREAAELFGPEQVVAGRYVQLEVSDNGAGMDEATQARMFDPFFTTKFTGRGLGLAAVQGIVRGHEGAIRVHSAPGVGTSFLILLPAGRKEVAAAVPEKPRPGPIPPGTVVLVIDDEESIRSIAGSALARAGVKVLTAEDGRAGVELFREHHGIISAVIDDEESIRAIAGSALARAGVKVLGAADGKAGVELFREHHVIVSAVILDLLMPVMGGEETLPLLEEIDPNVPVILSSGFDESEARRRFSEPKPEFFLQKPYTAGRLIEAVAAALQRER